MLSAGIQAKVHMSSKEHAERLTGHDNPYGRARIGLVKASMVKNVLV